MPAKNLNASSEISDDTRTQAMPTLVVVYSINYSFLYALTFYN